MGPPNPELCPIARPPTSAPTPAPTPPLVMSMSMSMDMGGLEGFSIEDLLDGESEYKGKNSSGLGSNRNLSSKIVLFERIVF